MLNTEKTGYSILMEPNDYTGTFYIHSLKKKKHLATFLGIVESKEWGAHPVKIPPGVGNGD